MEKRIAEGGLWKQDQNARKATYYMLLEMTAWLAMGYILGGRLQ